MSSKVTVLMPEDSTIEYRSEHLSWYVDEDTHSLVVLDNGTYKVTFRSDEWLSVTGEERNDGS